MTDTTDVATTGPAPIQVQPEWPVTVRYPQAVRMAPDNTGYGGSPLDLSELAARLVQAGLSLEETRAFMGEVQQIAANAAGTAASRLLELVNNIHKARFQDLTAAVAVLPTAPRQTLTSRMFDATAANDVVSRAGVQQLIQQMQYTPPRTSR